MSIQSRLSARFNRNTLPTPAAESGVQQAAGAGHSSPLQARLSEIPKSPDARLEEAEWPTALKIKLKKPEEPASAENPYTLAPAAEYEKAHFEKWSRDRAEEATKKLKIAGNSIKQALPKDVLEPESKWSRKLQKKLDVLEVEAKNNPSDRHISLICAVLQQVTGIYEIDDLPDAARLLTTKNEDLHRVEAEHILGEINQGLDAASKEVLLGTKADDPRLQRLIEYIGNKYSLGNIEIRVLTPSDNPDQLRVCTLSRPLPANGEFTGDALDIAILKTDKNFQAVTVPKTAVNINLSKKYYNDQKSTFGKIRSLTSDITSYNRSKARGMSDFALEKKLGPLPEDWVADRSDEYEKEWAKRTGLGGQRNLKGKRTFFEEANRLLKNGLPNQNLCAGLNSEELDIRFAKIEAEARGGPDSGFDYKEKQSIYEAVRKKTFNHDRPLFPTEMLARNISFSSPREIALNKIRYKHDALLKQGLVDQIPKVVVKPLANKFMIDQIKTDFDVYFAEAKKAGAENQLIKIASGKIEKAKNLFYEAILTADLIVLEKAKAEVISAIDILEGPGAGTRAAAESLHSQIDSVIGPASLNSSPEMKTYHERNLLSLNFTADEVQTIFLLEQKNDASLARIPKLIELRTEQSTRINLTKADRQQEYRNSIRLQKIAEGTLRTADEAHRTALAEYQSEMNKIQLSIRARQQTTVQPQDLNTACENLKNAGIEKINCERAIANYSYKSKIAEMGVFVFDLDLADIAKDKASYEEIRNQLATLKRLAQLEEHFDDQKISALDDSIAHVKTYLEQEKNRVENAKAAEALQLAHQVQARIAADPATVAAEHAAATAAAAALALVAATAAAAAAALSTAQN